MRRALAVLVLALGASFLAAPQALGKSFTLPSSSVDVTVRPDGAVRIVEHITYSFDGSFSGGYRDIPLAPGATLRSVQVSEGGTDYTPGAPTGLGSSGAPGSFGVTSIPEGVRVVWHYRATDEARTFDISYLYVGGLVVYDDVADLNLRVWGDHWDATVERLTADVDLPGADRDLVRVWGHSRLLDVGGTTALKKDGTGATLSATDVAPGNWVEIRVVFPTSLLSSTDGARRLSGNAFAQIEAEEREYAGVSAAQEEQRRRDRERLDSLIDRLPWLIPLALLIAGGPAALIAVWIWRRWGREPDVGEIPEHVFEPPGDEAPALVAALVAPRGDTVTGDAFTATLFDLIRRGFIDAMPTITEKKTWAGLKRDDVSDLAITFPEKDTSSLLPFERKVYKAFLEASKGDDRFHLTEMRDAIKKDQAHYAQVFRDFKKQVGTQVRNKGWWQKEGLTAAIVATVSFWLLAVGSGFAASFLWPEDGGFPWGTLTFGVITVLLGINALVMTVFLIYRRGWERRSVEGARGAAGWGAFRRFLGDFAGMAEAAPGSVAIWEQYLCYGIAFGVADRVLAAAQLHAPPELADTSHLYWIDRNGSLGSGPSLSGISALSSAIQSASIPSSSGGGGGFSGGGGGGGFGGGGGGAW